MSCKGTNKFIHVCNSSRISPSNKPKDRPYHFMTKFKSVNFHNLNASLSHEN